MAALMAALGPAPRPVLMLGLCAAALCGCAAVPGPGLPDRPALATSVAGLRHETALPARLGVEDLARLAVENDPDLRAARARHDIARAQLLQAGLLPNPQVSLTYTPTLAGPGIANAWSAGLSQDLRALILRPAAVRAARAGLHQVDAEILWQEWQVAGQARLLGVQLIEEARMLALQDRIRAVLERQTAALRGALARNDTTFASLAPDLGALAGLQAQQRDTRRLMLQQKQTLAVLLDLQPEAALPLAARAELAPFDAAAIRASVPTLPDRRPDLIALRWGYEASRQKLRTALLSQFPPLSFGPVGGSDNTNVRSMGPQLAFELPVFDQGQGGVAMARATRRQLYEAYVARLAATLSEVRARLDALDQIERQIRQAAPALAYARQAAASVQGGEVSRLIDPQARIDLLSAYVTRQTEMIALQQASLEQQVAIETLAGTGLPSAAPALRIAQGAPR